ncbi:MAG: hypothetical protein IKI75_06310 [Lachnospiraceae bacterium]|nr:hypothetical protein [Lachnospiraceae bacterium]
MKYSIVNVAYVYVTLLSAYDIFQIEDELLEELSQAYDEHNVICAKDEKWAKLRTLSFHVIAIIILRLFDFVMIPMTLNRDRKECDLMIYVGDRVVSLFPECEKDRDIYIEAENLLNQIIVILNKSLPKKQREEVISKLKDKADIRDCCYDQDIIPVNNGLFDFKNKVLETFSPDYVFRNKIRTNYNPLATNIRIFNPEDGTDFDIESFMMDLAAGDVELCNCLWEVVGAVVRPNVDWNTSAWLYSEKGNNGKTTFNQLLRNLLGENNYISLSLSQMAERFSLEPIIKASAVIGDENDVSENKKHIRIEHSAPLKTIITKDVLSIDRKYKSYVQIRPRVFVVQNLNSMPSVSDKSQSYLRRMRMFPMKADFNGAVERKYIKKDYIARPEILEYCLKRVLHMDNYEISEPEACKELKREFQESNDICATFWREFREEYAWRLLPFSFLHAHFLAYSKRIAPASELMDRDTFVTSLLRVIRDDDMWYCQDRKRQVNVNKTNMSGPEPLIYEYGLTEWMSKTYKGNDINKICIPVLKKKYAGIERI